MGYRSQVMLKTTTEGYLLCKKFDDSIEEHEKKPLAGMEIRVCSSGNYKISHDWIKWYEDVFADVANFIEMLTELDNADIPYTFIRIGEDVDDIEIRSNFPVDTPESIYNTTVYRDFNDPEDAYYESVKKV